MFKFFRRHDRQTRRLQERGRPATARVLAAQPTGGESWTLHLEVTPSDGPAFTTQATTTCPTGHGPAAGAIVAVIYDPENRHTVLAEQVPTAAPGDDADSGTDISGLLSRAINPSGTDTTTITVNGVPAERAAADPDHAGLDRGQLRALAAADPAAGAAEILRRLATGELTPTRVETSEVTVHGDEAADALADLQAKGLLSPAQLEEIRRGMTGG